MVFKAATKASNDIVRFISTQEGFGAVAYQHPGDVPTIGYGHTEGIRESDVGHLRWSQAHALIVLHADLDTKYGPMVTAACKHAGYRPSQHQFDALLDFCYNLGPGYFGPEHTIGTELYHHDRKGIANAMLLYDKEGTTTLPGLAKRRQADKRIFLGGHYR